MNTKNNLLNKSLGENNIIENNHQFKSIYFYVITVLPIKTYSLMK